MFTLLLIPVDIAPQAPIDAYLDITSTQDKVLRLKILWLKLCDNWLAE